MLLSVASSQVTGWNFTNKRLDPNQPQVNTPVAPGVQPPSGTNSVVTIAPTSVRPVLIQPRSAPVQTEVQDTRVPLTPFAATMAARRNGVEKILDDFAEGFRQSGTRIEVTRQPVEGSLAFGAPKRPFYEEPWVWIGAAVVLGFVAAKGAN